MSGGDSTYGDDVPPGGEDWAGEWETVSVVPQCGPDHPAGDCICLRLVRLSADGTFVQDSSLSWDRFTPLYRFDQSGEYSEEGLLDPTYGNDRDVDGAFYHPYYEQMYYDERAGDDDTAGAVYVVPVNVYGAGLSGGGGVPSDMSGYSCEACRKLSPSYVGWETEGPMYGVDDGGEVDEFLMTEGGARGSGRHDVTRGETDCRGLNWYLSWLEEYETYNIDGGYQWAISALFQQGNFDYLDKLQIKNESTDWSGYTSHGVNNSPQWRYAWFMPWYSKFFESIETESYKMRFLLFNGWTKGHGKTGGRTTVAPGGYKFLAPLQYTANMWDTTQITGEGTDPGYWLNFSCQVSSIDGPGVDATITYRDDRYSGTEAMFAEDVPTVNSYEQFLRSEYFEADVDNPRQAHKNTIYAVADSPVWLQNNGKHMFLSKTQFYDELRNEDDEATHHRMLWPLCVYSSHLGQHGETSFNKAGNNGIGTTNWGRGTYPAIPSGQRGAGVHAKINTQLGSANPRAKGMRTDGNIVYIYPQYNPNEREGLIERFGPYHYLGEDHKDWNVSFPGYNEAWTWGFEADRRTIAQIKTWYNYYTDLVHQDWLYDENRAEGQERMKSDLAFTKVKATKYDANKIYSIGSEAQPQRQIVEFDVSETMATDDGGSSDSGGYS